jgi:two-component system, NtrC family, sensor kinase
MQRRGESGQPVKGQTANRPKARKAATAHVSTADLQEQVAALTSELKEAQQTATSEVLKVISSSPGELEPVFNALLENAVRICGAKFGILYLCEGDGFRTVAMQDVPRYLPRSADASRFSAPVRGVPWAASCGRGK